jgi:hypothetical protein
MGYSSWSDKAYEHISNSRKGMTDHTVSTHVFKSSSLHASLDPKGVKVRESRDSTDHPESNAIGVIFDVTGSMRTIPVRFAKDKLGGLMSMLFTKGVVPHPQVCFGAVGDAYCDSSPFQIGQFESGLEADACLTNVHLEGGGGGSNSESYGLAHYFFARRTSIDCWEKRGKKGYLFTLGDEKAHPKITKTEAEEIFGDKLQSDLDVQEVIRECEARYNVFHIVVGGGSSNGDDPAIMNHWKERLGERVLKLNNPDEVCELIAATIGLCEGKTIDDMSSVLRGAGASAGTVKSVSNAIVPLRDALVRSAPGSLSGKLPTGADAGGTVRL